MLVTVDESVQGADLSGDGDLDDDVLVAERRAARRGNCRGTTRKGRARLPRSPTGARAGFHPTTAVPSTSP